MCGPLSFGTFTQTVDIELATQISGLAIHISVVHPDVFASPFPYLRM